MKLNLGAGNDSRSGYVNHDIQQLEGIQIVHDLNSYPWPWEDNSIQYILAIDVIEHLVDVTKTMEEIYRILKPGDSVEIRVPYWNSWCAHADPTHKHTFHELTFRYFDIESPFYQERKYYTNAKFIIKKESFIIAPFTHIILYQVLVFARYRGNILKK